MREKEKGKEKKEKEKEKEKRQYYKATFSEVEIVMSTAHSH